MEDLSHRIPVRRRGRPCAEFEGSFSSAAPDRGQIPAGQLISRRCGGVSTLPPAFLHTEVLGLLRDRGCFHMLMGTLARKRTLFPGYKEVLRPRSATRRPGLLEIVTFNGIANQPTTEALCF